MMVLVTIKILAVDNYTLLWYSPNYTKFLIINIIDRSRSQLEFRIDALCYLKQMASERKQLFSFLLIVLLLHLHS